MIPYQTGIFCEVSVQMCAGVSGRPRLRTLISMTFRRDSLGEKMPGSLTYRQSLRIARSSDQGLKVRIADSLRHGRIPQEHPKDGIAVCRGFNRW